MRSVFKSVTSVLLAAATALLAGCGQKEYEIVDGNGNTVLNTDYTAPEFHIKETTKTSPDTGGVDVVFIADKEDRIFYRKDGETLRSFYVSGVDMGLSAATTDMDNPNVPYETYLEWFAQIKEMHANTVRVFTEMPPQFYSALLDYNTQHPEDPLYLMHGIWFPENYMWDYPMEAFDEDEVVIRAFEKSAREICNVVHGNCKGITYGRQQNVDYSYDVSEWLVGYILGLEWSADFVDATNAHTDMAAFEGEYLKTSADAAPFEAFLCRIGNTLIAHETENYGSQTPVAFLNWMTTDPLTHTNEPYPEEDQAAVDTENILATDLYVAGLYAALDIYPYYPEFINYQPEYVGYTDPLTGRQNNYKAYLLDLKEAYSVPVIVAEFGVPTSRGVASESILGYNQGGLTEQEQGMYVSNMIVDIASSGYAGSLIFSWQDEWFKQTWNTFRYGARNPATRTPNVMSAEQNYGILAMLPGAEDTVVVDGDAAEWTDADVVMESSAATLSAKADEGYLYLYAKLKGRKTFDNTKLFIPVSTLGIGSETYKAENLTFDAPADFIVCLDGKEESKVLADEYYDFFQYRYGWIMGWVITDNNFGVRNTGEYVTQRQWVTGELELPETGETVPPIIKESGRLLYGTTDPKSKAYNAIADFIYKKNVAEIRIPWYLLNVLNMREGVCINDFMKDNAEGTASFSQVLVGAGLNGDSLTLQPVNIEPKDASEYHTRLKRSYETISATLNMLHSAE